MPGPGTAATSPQPLTPEAASADPGCRAAAARARPRATPPRCACGASLGRMLRTCMSTVRVLSTSSLGDLAVRQALGDEPHHLELAAREARGLVLGGGAAAEVLVRATRRARRPPRRPGGERRAPSPGRPVGLGQAFERRVALARGGQRDAGAEQDLRALERDARGRRAARRARPNCCGGGVGVALGQRGLAERVGERGERVGVARRRGDRRQRLGARAGVGRAAPAPASQPGRPAQAPDGVVVVLLRSQRASTSAAVLRRARRSSPSCAAEPRERRGAVALHRDDVEPRRVARQRVSSGRAAAPWPRQTRIAPSTPSATSVSPRRRPGAMQLARRARCASSQSPSSRST